jgi:hypothetical protein
MVHVTVLVITKNGLEDLDPSLFYRYKARHCSAPNSMEEAGLPQPGSMFDFEVRISGSGTDDCDGCGAC